MNTQLAYRLTRVLSRSPRRLMREALMILSIASASAASRESFAGGVPLGAGPATAAVATSSASADPSSLDVGAAKVRVSVMVIGGRSGWRVGVPPPRPAGVHEPPPPPARQERVDPRTILGTGVIISRKHRLVATAAHVADAAVDYGGLVSVADGTADLYEVDAIWYHPSLRRWFDVGLSAESTDPYDGEVATPAFDVAIMRLAAGGPPLPGECTLATDEELSRLGGEVVGLLGFPSEAGAGWPTASSRARATFAAGKILEHVAYTDRDEAEPAAPGPGHLVRTTAGLGPGASGGPLFLGSGRVVALRFGTSETSDGTPVSEYVRVDTIRDILTCYELTGRSEGSAHPSGAAAVQSTRLDVGRLRRAVKLVRGAEQLLADARYSVAADHCSEALSLIPQYGWARLRRAEAYLYFVQASWSSLPSEQRRQYCSYAIADIERCAKQVPEHLCWTHRTYLLCGYANLYLGLAFADRDTLQADVEWLGRVAKMRRSADSDEEKAELLNLRAFCREKLGDFGGARMDFDESIRLNDSHPRWYRDRAGFWTRRNRPELADRDRVKAARLGRQSAPP
jgi:hypothetical protein